ncbi:hypothetical protein ACQZ45_24815 [Agrobacterium sp. 16-2014-1-2a]
MMTTIHASAVAEWQVLADLRAEHNSRFKMADNKKKKEIKSVMFDDTPAPQNSTLADADRQLLIDQGLNPDDYEYVPGYDPASAASVSPWTKQEGDVVYYDDQTPINVSDVELEVPTSVRFEIGALSKPEDRLTALRKYYPDAQPVGTDQFVMRDPETDRAMVFNVKSWIPSWGDVGDAAPEIVGTAGAIGGGILGGVAGAGAGSVVPVVGTTTGALAAGAAGAGTGYAAGRDIYQRGANLIFGNEDTRTAGEQVIDAAQDFGIGATGELGGTIVGGAVARGIGKAVDAVRPSRLIGGLTPADDAAKAAQRLQSFGDIGIQPTPGMIGGPVAATREQSRLSGNSVMSNRVGEIYDDVSKRFDDVIDRTTGGRNLSAAEAGDAIQQRAQDFKSIVKGRQNELYDDVGRLTQGIGAEAPNTTQFLKNTKEEYKQLGQSAKMNAGSAYETTIKQAEAILSDVQAGASFDTLKQARTAIGDIAFDRNLPTREGQLYRNLYKSLTDDMTATAEKGGEDVIQAMRKANNFTTRTKNPGNLVSQNIPDEILRKQVPEAA